jgi:outer membrane protein assembly factor BamB
MQLISSFYNVDSMLIFNDSLYFINVKDRNLYELNYEKIIKRRTEKRVDIFISHFGTIFYQSANGIYNLNDHNHSVLQGQDDELLSLQKYFFEDQIVVSSTPKNDWMPNASYIIYSSLENRKLKFAFRYDLKVGSIYINYNQTELFTYSNAHEQMLRVDVSKFDRNVGHDPKTGEVLWDKSNAIHEKPLGDNEKIYVPLTGGQLVALFAETGEKAWLWAHNRTGTYQILGEYIYKHDGISFFEINASNGTLNREKKFNDDPMIEGFHASGSLWVYEDVVVVCDVLNGKICMLDRNSLDVIEVFSLDKKLINSERTIVWHKEKLYVLDIDNTLHIFER